MEVICVLVVVCCGAVVLVTQSPVHTIINYAHFIVVLYSATLSRNGSCTPEISFLISFHSNSISRVREPLCKNVAGYETNFFSLFPIPIPIPKALVFIQH